MSEEKKIRKIVIDRNLCIGAASCLVGADNVFELDAENKAVLKVKNGQKSSSAQKSELEDNSVSDEALLAAAQSCPTAAIFLFDENNQQIYP